MPVDPYDDGYGEAPAGFQGGYPGYSSAGGASSSSAAGRHRTGGVGIGQPRSQYGGRGGNADLADERVGGFRPQEGRSGANPGCPNCGTPAVPIFYGKPDQNAIDKASRGQIVLGGAQRSAETHQCTNCGNAFSLQARGSAQPMWEPPSPGKAGRAEYEADRARRMALERELEDLQSESERGKQALDGLGEKIRGLRAEVEEQRRQKPAQCSSCRTVTLQVDAAAQSLLGAAGHVVRTLLRDANADRGELLDTVLRYVEPVKHLDPDLESLYARARETSVRGTTGRTGGGGRQEQGALAARGNQRGGAGRF